MFASFLLPFRQRIQLFLPWTGGPEPFIRLLFGPAHKGLIDKYTEEVILIRTKQKGYIEKQTKINFFEGGEAG